MPQDATVSLNSDLPTPPYGFRGLKASIHAQCLSVADEVHGFVTDEAWITNTQGMIEAGQEYGDANIGRRYFFWADLRPGHDYYEHRDTSHIPNSSTSYSTQITPDGPILYYAQSGPYSGESAGGWANNYVFEALETGTETSKGAISTYFGATGSLGLWYGNPILYRDMWQFGPSGHTHDASDPGWGFTIQVTKDVWYRYGNTTVC
jgi:hypothetical protein